MAPTSRTAGGDDAGGGPGDGVRITSLDTMDEARAAADLWRAVWGGEQYPVQPALLVALAHSGGYVSGAVVGDRLVGASMGWPGPPDDHLLHSHITGVLPDHAGRGIGLALKHHQAAWCREHGLDRVTWTFDPLVARNAWFNLARLGVEVSTYHVDHYGEMPDARNRGQGSDRLLVTWHLDDPTNAPRPTPPTPGIGGVVRGLLVGDGEEPERREVAPDAQVVAVAVPHDVEALRDRDPGLAIRWRHAVRDVLGSRLAPHVADPWRVATFTRDGTYLLTPPPT